MRSPRAKQDVWPFGGADPPVDEGFDSFGPASDIWRALHPGAERSERARAPTPHDRTRILLAEREAFHRRILRILLASPNISLIEVEDGQAAIDLLALRSFDVVLLDLGLPRMNGADTLRWVRRSQTPWADIPIIGLVDEAHISQVGRLLSDGMTDWIGKPVNRTDLIDAFRRTMPGLQDADI